MLTSIYEVRGDSLADPQKRAQLVAFMKALLLGWRDSLGDPDLSARLTVEVYGKGNGLDFAAQKAGCLAANDFVVSPETREHGLFWMSPRKIAETVATLGAGGIRVTPALFTNEIQEEAYRDLASQLRDVAPRPA
jgi:hypothetical protein